MQTLVICLLFNQTCNQIWQNSCQIPFFFTNTNIVLLNIMSLISFFSSNQRSSSSRKLTGFSAKNINFAKTKSHKVKYGTQLKIPQGITEHLKQESCYYYPFATFSFIQQYKKNGLIYLRQKCGIFWSIVTFH